MKSLVKKKVYIVQRYLPHYRLTFFDNLSKNNNNIKIEVLHGGDISENHHKTQQSSKYSFNENKFPNITIRIFKFTFVFQLKTLIYVMHNSPDLLILEGTFGIVTNYLLILLRKIIRKPTIYWSAGWDNPDIYGWKHSMKSAFIKLSLKLIDGVIVYGSKSREMFIKYGADPKNIVIAQNTIDIESIVKDSKKFKEDARKIISTMGLDDKKIIIYTGGFSKYKKVHNLLLAFKKIKNEFHDTACVLIGTGNLLKEEMCWVEENNIPDVYFLGEIITGVESYMSMGSIFVLPGIGGLAINQAMALGLPVISSVADGTQYDLIIDGFNGFIVGDDDIDCLVKHLRYILSEPEIIEQMGRNAQQSILKTASLKNMVDQFSSVIMNYL